MKLFQLVQKYLNRIGIHWHRSDQQHSPINWIRIVYFTAYAQSIISSVGFMLYEAETAVEYGFAFYVFATACVAAAAVFVAIWKIENIINTIQSFENFIEKRK